MIEKSESEVEEQTQLNVEKKKYNQSTDRNEPMVLQNNKKFEKSKT
jgi:hypothetical protein